MANCTFEALARDWAESEARRLEAEETCQEDETDVETSEHENELDILRNYIDENYETLQRLTEYLKDKHEPLGLMTDMTYIDVMRVLEDTMIVRKIQYNDSENGDSETGEWGENILDDIY